MTQPVLNLILISAGFILAFAIFGYAPVYLVGYGAFSLMAAVISLTFLWLWARRATPLALGMAFSWAGAASVMGWWWQFQLADRPEWTLENPLLFLFLACYFVGAILHFEVIGRSFGLSRRVQHLPVLLCLAISLSAALMK